MTKAILHHTGKVIWKPPAIYKSFCEIDVEYFPFDQQICFMKFGSWTYDGYTVDLRHLLQSEDSNRIEVAVDLTDYYISVEWDILSVHAERHEKFYICCEEPYPDIIFYLRLRRKTLFYVVNLIIPCVGISFLSVLVFYLPSHSGEKVSLSISILLSLTVFFLLLVEIIPSTSLTVSLLGKYLLFTMVLVTLSVVVTIIVLNINFRSPVTHRMAPRLGKPPDAILTDVFRLGGPESDKYDGYCRPGLPASDGVGKRFSEYEMPPGLPSLPGSALRLDYAVTVDPPPPPPPLAPNFDKTEVRPFERSIEDARFIAQHARNKDKFEAVEEDWKYVAMVVDRIFLWLFTLMCVVGTAIIIMQAPSLYDTTKPIDIQYSKIAKKKLMLLSMASEEN
ncbi:hypothetical protein QAD02_024345 [Eretmocerus hayati]|uniref:Uncharacterized protein n=1 Tax=Eretmocerus hayati TaxID=131215 RepID=A0ACC2PYQ4_9HYME|nr:hypothetical protein QAD02_024345 [Eretmocerus hayati]